MYLFGVAIGLFMSSRWSHAKYAHADQPAASAAYRGDVEQGYYKHQGQPPMSSSLAPNIVPRVSKQQAMSTYKPAHVSQNVYR